jgi:hypothetical protein
VSHAAIPIAPYAKTEVKVKAELVHPLLGGAEALPVTGKPLDSKLSSSLIHRCSAGMSEGKGRIHQAAAVKN